MRKKKVVEVTGQNTRNSVHCDPVYASAISQSTSLDSFLSWNAGSTSAVSVQLTIPKGARKK